MSKNAPKSMCVDTIKAIRMAHVLVKKGRHDNYQIRQLIRGKVGIVFEASTIAGVKRSYCYQVGKALSLVM